MQDLQAIFLRIQQKKKKKKDLTKAYKDALLTSQEYVEVKEELDRLREKKKGIEASIKSMFANELIEIDDLKLDIKSDEELMSDIAITQITQGTPIEIKDEHEQEYEPVINVKFKKIK